MGHGSGNTQGFGRVSTHTRPSPYSPLHFRGGLSASQRETQPVGSSRRSRARRVVFAAAVLAALVAGVGYVALFRSPGVPVPRTAVTPAPAAAMTGVEGQTQAPQRAAIAAKSR